MVPAGGVGGAGLMAEADRLLNGDETGGSGGFGKSSIGLGSVDVESPTADFASDSVTSGVLSSNFGAGGSGGNGGGGGINVVGFASLGIGGFDTLDKGGSGGSGGGMIDDALDAPGAGSSFSSQFGREGDGFGGIPTRGGIGGKVGLLD